MKIPFQWPSKAFFCPFCEVQIIQNIPKYSKLFLNIPKYSKLFQNIPKYSNTSKIFQNIQNIPKVRGTTKFYFNNQKCNKWPKYG